MGKFNEEMAKAGVLLAGEGLQATSKGAKIKFTPGQKPVAGDGPFAETKELIAGFWLIQVTRARSAKSKSGECSIRRTSAPSRRKTNWRCAMRSPRGR